MDPGSPHGPPVEASDTLVLAGMTPGAYFAERFRVDALLGVGAMGKVFRATDIVTGEEVALKILHPDKARKTQILQRFRREAEILRRLAHPAIVQVRESGTAPDGTDYIVMELLTGRTLRDELRERGPLPVHDVLRYLISIVDALTAAHHKGVVHRDIKPDNVFMVHQGDPPTRLVDFGLSLLATDARMTKTGVMLGTPRYMAPEQIHSAKSADARTDIYSLGVLVHEMLTGGKSPFKAEDTGQLLGCVLEGRIVRIEEVRPDLPPGLGDAIRRAMAKNSRDRFATSGSFAEAFAACLGMSTGRSHLSEVDLDALFAAQQQDDGAAPLDPIAFDAGPPPTPPAGPLHEATLGFGAPPRDPSQPPPPAAPDPTAPMFTPPTGVSRAQVAAALQQAPRTSAPPVQAAPIVPGAPRFSAVSHVPAAPQARPAPERRGFPWWVFLLAILAVAICSAGSVLGARGCIGSMDIGGMGAKETAPENKYALNN